MDLIIVGVGKFGSALAGVYERKGIRVHKIQNHKSSLTLSESAVQKSYILLCVPTQAIPDVTRQRKSLFASVAGIVSTAKGIIQSTGETPTSYLDTHVKNHRGLFTMSGPSFAAELKKGQPTALVLAGKERRGVDFLSENLSGGQLRLYKSHDPYGVELCGALKNVYAIASGISAGLGFGDNTRAALTTRALAEMGRITRALGAHPMTVVGLAGAGDLFLTCSSKQSRNFQFGYGLAKGVRPEKLLKKLGTVEGVWTASVARRICRKHGLRTPLIDTITALLNDKTTPQDALIQLMSGKVRHEFE